MHTIWKQTKFLNRIDTPATIQGWCWAIISVAKSENVPPTIDTPKNCLPFYRYQTPLHKLIIASYRPCGTAVPSFCHSDTNTTTFSFQVILILDPTISILYPISDLLKVNLKLCD